MKKKRSSKSLAQQHDRAYAEFEALARKVTRPKPEGDTTRPEATDSNKSTR